MSEKVLYIKDYLNRKTNTVNKIDSSLASEYNNNFDNFKFAFYHGGIEINHLTTLNELKECNIDPEKILCFSSLFRFKKTKYEIDTWYIENFLYINSLKSVMPFINLNDKNSIIFVSDLETISNGKKVVFKKDGDQFIVSPLNKKFDQSEALMEIF